MFNLLLALHVLVAVFAVGPLVHAATTAGRGVRRADASATAESARMLRIYAYASVLVVVLGFALMSAKSPETHKAAAQFSETWVWLSTLLWAVAVAVVLAVLAPGLDQASDLIGRHEPVRALTARIAATGGAVGVIFAVIVFLMVYRPGG